MAELIDERGEHVARHTASALKPFLKLVLKPRDPALFRPLYGSFTTVKYRPNGRGNH